MKTLALATFNLYGLTKPHKQRQLIGGVTRYRTNVFVIQKKFLKITIKREFIPDPKHIIKIFNAYAPTTLLVIDDVSVLINFYNDTSTDLIELEKNSLVF